MRKNQNGGNSCFFRGRLISQKGVITAREIKTLCYYLAQVTKSSALDFLNMTIADLSDFADIAKEDLDKRRRKYGKIKHI